MKEKLIRERNALYGNVVMRALQRRDFEVYYTHTKEEALEQAMELIPKGDVVGWGGSLSIQEIGLIDKLYEEGYTVMDRDKVPAEEKRKFMKRIVAEADTFITSANAITEDGQLLYVDGNGNRVASIAYGADNVVVIAGLNKVVRNIDDAIYRIRTIAGPLNAQRFPDMHTHCRHTGKCGECFRHDCICNTWYVVNHCNPKRRIKIVLVGEELGF